MKTKDKVLRLLNHGFNSDLLSQLNENQIEALHKRLVEAKKESKEATTKTETKTYTDYTSGEVNTLKSKGQSINIPAGGQIQPLPDGGMRVVQETDDIENDDISLSLGAEGKNDMALALSNMEMTEKFESKAQQKYFWAKCQRSKGKEKKKWCDMADEFSKSTSKKQYKTMPEKINPEKTVKYKKKKEANENYLDMVGKAYNKNMLNKISDIKPGISWGESEIQKGIMKLLEKHITPKMSKKDFLKLVSEQGETEEPITKPKPGTRPTPTIDPDFDPFINPDPSDQPEAESPEPITKPKPKPETMPTPTTDPDFDPFINPDPSDQPEARGGGFKNFMSTVKRMGLLKK